MSADPTIVAPPSGPSRGRGPVPVGVFDPGAGPVEELRLPVLVGFALVVLVGFTVAPALVATLVAMVAIVTVHELGHYLVARRAGMHTPEFMVGFGPLLWSRRRGETRWGLRAIPLIGYVRITGMSSVEPVAAELEARTYRAQPARWRIAVSAAGPASNFAFAIALLFVTIAGVGLRVPVSTPTIGTVVARSPAADAGFRPGDRVIGAGGTSVRQWPQFVRAVKHTRTTLAVVVLRGGETRTLTVRPVRQAGAKIIGVTQEMHSKRRDPLTAARMSVVASVKFTAVAAEGTVHMLANLPQLFGRVAGGRVEPTVRPVSPIGMAQVASDAASHGLGAVLALAALINLMIAIFNLIPVPPFDGGHIAVAALESVLSVVRRRPTRVSHRVILPVAVAVWLVFVLLALSALWLDVVDPVRLAR